MAARTRNHVESACKPRVEDGEKRYMERDITCAVRASRPMLPVGPMQHACPTTVIQQSQLLRLGGGSAALVSTQCGQLGADFLAGASDDFTVKYAGEVSHDSPG
jgi:hypothetical protein